MDPWRSISLVGLAAISSLTTLSFDSSNASDHPVLTAALILIFAGLALVSTSRYISSFFDSTVPYREVPISDLPLGSLGALDGSTFDTLHIPSEPSKPQLYFYGIFLLAVLGILIRIEIFRRTFGDPQCAQLGIESFILIPIALYEWWMIRRREARHEVSVFKGEGVLARLTHITTKSDLRHVFAAALISIGAVIAASYSSRPQSTYICAQHTSTLIPFFQYFGILVDVVILFSLWFLLHDDMCVRFFETNHIPIVTGYVSLVAGSILAFIILFLSAVSEHSELGLFIFDFAYINSVFWHGLMFTVAAALALRNFPKNNPLIPPVTVTVTCAILFLFSSAWQSSGPVIPISNRALLVSSTLLSAGFLLFLTNLYPDTAHRVTTASTTSIRRRVSLGVFVSVACLWLTRNISSPSSGNIATNHPIDVLIQAAQLRYETWEKQASKSKSLKEAVVEYRARYHRHPPPGFDEWYQYATERNSFVIDDYDSIYDDLLPFWSLSPAELRSRTWESTSNAWNGISAIRIRNGETDLGPNTIPTHRWMVEGVAELIAPFAKHLPDVAMAFNLNDECRVAVPWKEANAMYASGRQGHEPEGALSSSWSKDRPGDWKDVPEESIPQTRFSDNNLANTFRNWGAVTCPTVSASQKTIRDQRVDCVTCSQPHSYGHFVQNWTKAADICHQPDLEHLHGLFLSPAAFKGTHELMPVFSQSKVLGFNDIRYPSAWNYVDKVKYDPSDKYPDPAFKTKMNTLFWRGGTSEGLSVHGTWKGMVRQRLVSLARGRWPHLITALIPIGSNSKEYEYKKVPASELNEKLELDIGIVDKIDRCNGHDCDDEAQEFEFKEPVDFQEHWRYKYLFDLDGAGFSGRFLPFLKSHSVPFKVALFREWYDSRLTPWLHFVPQDVRLQGVHSTLAYFVGLDGRLAGRRVTMEAHNEQGEKIAEAGRVLAKKALRKEDMEIYFYRLLLEWARLTDDRRDELGFTA